MKLRLYSITSSAHTLTRTARRVVREGYHTSVPGTITNSSHPLGSVFLYAFDVVELDERDLRGEPIEASRATDAGCILWG
jgi:hypothetical protein